MRTIVTFAAVNGKNDIWRQDSLPEVVVTGIGTQHLLKHAPVQTEVITSKMLQGYAGKSIAINALLYIAQTNRPAQMMTPVTRRSIRQ